MGFITMGPLCNVTLSRERDMNAPAATEASINWLALGVVPGFGGRKVADGIALFLEFLE
jgi:hypothetical protein